MVAKFLSPDDKRPSLNIDKDNSFNRLPIWQPACFYRTVPAYPASPGNAFVFVPPFHLLRTLGSFQSARQPLVGEVAPTKELGFFAILAGKDVVGLEGARTQGLEVGRSPLLKLAANVGGQIFTGGVAHTAPSYLTEAVSPAPGAKPGNTGRLKTRPESTKKSLVEGSLNATAITEVRAAPAESIRVNVLGNIFLSSATWFLSTTPNTIDADNAPHAEAQITQPPPLGGTDDGNQIGIAVPPQGAVGRVAIPTIQESLTHLAFVVDLPAAVQKPLSGASVSHTPIPRDPPFEIQNTTSVPPSPGSTTGTDVSKTRADSAEALVHMEGRADLKVIPEVPTSPQNTDNSSSGAGNVEPDPLVSFPMSDEKSPGSQSVRQQKGGLSVAKSFGRIAEPNSCSPTAISQALPNQRASTDLQSEMKSDPKNTRRISEDVPAAAEQTVKSELIREPITQVDLSGQVSRHPARASPSESSQPPERTLSRSLSMTLNPPQQPQASSPSQIAIRLDPGDGKGQVELRIRERAGDVQISVRSTDQDLASSLRQDLGELVRRLNPSDPAPPHLHLKTAAEASDATARSVATEPASKNSSMTEFQHRQRQQQPRQQQPQATQRPKTNVDRSRELLAAFAQFSEGVPK